jgi:hypothetical protein
MTHLNHIKNGTSRTYVVTTQNVEEYGDNFHKFKVVQSTLYTLV